MFKEDDDPCGTAAAKALSNRLIILDRGTTVAECSNDDVGKAREQSTHQKSRLQESPCRHRLTVVPIFACCARNRDLVKDIQLRAGQITVAFSIATEFAL